MTKDPQPRHGSHRAGKALEEAMFGSVQGMPVAPHMENRKEPTMEFNDRAVQSVHLQYSVLMMFVPYPQEVLDARKAAANERAGDALSMQFAQDLYTREVAAQLAAKAADLNMVMLEDDLDDAWAFGWGAFGVTFTRHVGMKTQRVQVSADGHQIILGCTGYEGTTEAGVK